MEKCLYDNGNTIHFSKYGDLPCIRAKQINRGIPMSVKDNQLQFKVGRTTFGIKVVDRFQTDEVNAILDYLAEPEIIDNKAIQALLVSVGNTGYICILPLKAKQSRNTIKLAIPDISWAKVLLVQI